MSREGQRAITLKQSMQFDSSRNNRATTPMSSRYQTTLTHQKNTKSQANILDVYMTPKKSQALIKQEEEKKKKEREKKKEEEKEEKKGDQDVPNQH